MNKMQNNFIKTFSLFVFCFFSPHSLSALEEVSFQLKYFHQFQFAGYYAADIKGYYQDAGLKVNIIEGAPSKNPVDMVLKKNAEFGVSDSDILTSKIKGSPLIIIGAVFQNSPYILVTEKEKNITLPQDLIGKKIMTSQQGLFQLKMMLMNEGIPLTQVEFIDHSWNYDDLFDPNKDIAAMTAYITTDVYDIEMKGKQVNIINPKNYGVDFYGDLIFTSESYAKKNPEAVHNFMEATKSGWEYAFQYPDEIIDYIISLDTGRGETLSRSRLLYEMNEMKKLIHPEVIEIGHVNPWRIEKLIRSLYEVIDVQFKGNTQNILFYQSSEKNTFLLPVIVLGILIIGTGIIIYSVFKIRKLRLSFISNDIKTLMRQQPFLKQITNQSPVGFFICQLSEGSKKNIYLNSEILSLFPNKNKNQILDYLTESSFNRDQIFVYHQEIHSRNKKEKWLFGFVITTKILENYFHFQASSINQSKGYFIEDFPNPVWIASEEGSLAFLNKAWLDFTGRQLDEERGNGWSQGIHPDDFDYTIENFRKSFEQKKEIQIEFRLKNHESDFHWVKMHGVPNYNQKNRFEGYIGYLNDIHDTRIKEINLQKDKLKAEKASRSKSNFIYNMSHEIRIPLNGIINIAELIRQIDDDEKKDYYIDLIKSSSTQIRNIIEDLINISLLETGQRSSVKSSHNFRKLLNDIIKSLTFMAQQKNIHLAYFIPAEIPTYLYFDRSALTQILINLIHYSIQYTSEGKIELSVKEIYRDQKTIFLRIEQKDTGTGIPNQLLEPLYKDFNETAHFTDSNSIGFSIIKNLLNQNEGSIQIDQSSEKGSHFTIEMPFVIAEDDYDQTTQIRKINENPDKQPTETLIKTETSNLSPFDFKEISILIVEDNPINMLAVSEYIKYNLGSTVIEANNGQEAINQIMQNPVHLIIMDIQMPVVDGFEATRKIRNIEKDQSKNPVPVIGLTGFASKNDEQKCYEAGMNIHMPKPVDFEKLTKKIKELLTME